ncbi:preprotein translocase subunit SecE [Enterococcus sp. PF1-24]|uniref:preprotein translocase subunit SecE n=1 Tax=unclassified Enterococcus TaxID=2608891 RepID=UPI002473BF5E|nr:MULTISPECIES: preprotein translocase subunit SecE [unclassified Enterococcus]MDH6363532.1 preprotein translocase subunit SecE [Enterococcus sp. PFB1-1]MDH6400767.1 preprotein translocase subunit SecE [Enterococcus sp. PF1-24]
MKFLRSVVDEMKKVTWPNGKKLRRDTLTVVQTSIIFGVFFFVVDSVITFALSSFVK